VIQKRFFVNGVERSIIMDNEDSLAKILREQLGLTGTKVGCDTGQCGSWKNRAAAWYEPLISVPPGANTNSVPSGGYIWWKTPRTFFP